MRQLYYLSGPSGAGKSCTLRLLYQRLTGAVVDEGELDVELYYRGLKMAIFSRSDGLPLVQDRLQELVQSDCQLIVCVSKGRGQLNNFLEEETPRFGFTVEAIHKPKAATRQYIDAENEMTTNLLYAKLNAWLEANNKNRYPRDK